MFAYYVDFVNNERFGCIIFTYTHVQIYNCIDNVIVKCNRWLLMYLHCKSFTHLQLY